MDVVGWLASVKVGDSVSFSEILVDLVLSCTAPALAFLSFFQLFMQISHLKVNKQGNCVLFNYN